jgi:hypothetical protein
MTLRRAPILNATPVIHLLHYFVKIVELDYDALGIVNLIKDSLVDRH